MKMKFLDKIGAIFKSFLFRFLFFKDVPFLKLVLILGGLGAGVLLLFNLSTFLPEKLGWRDYLQKADRLYQEGELEKAKKVYLKLRKEFPSNPQMNWVNYQLANCFKNSGLIHRAIFFYEKVTTRTSFPYYFEAKYDLAHCYQKIGELDKTIKITEEMIEEFPQTEKLPELYLILADCLSEQSREEKAISIYQRIIENYPGSISSGIAYLKLGNIYFKKNQYSEAILFYSSIIKDYPETQFQEKALFNLADCYLAEEKVDEALSMLFLLSEKYPRSELFIDGLFLVGENLLKKGKFQEARKIFEKISKIYPKRLSVKKRLAETYLAEGNYSQAIETYEKILKDYPYLQDKERIYLTLGSLYLNTDNYLRAIQIFEKFIYYFPLSTKIFFAYFNLGKAFFSQKLYFKAIEAFVQALRHSSSREEADKALSEMAEVYIKVGLWDEAIECLKKRLSLASQEKENLSVQIKLIGCYLKKKELSSAKELLFPHLKNFPRDKTLEFLDIADLFYSTGEGEIAYSIYQKAGKFILPEDKRWFSILFKIADFQKDKGQIDSAITTYERILKFTENDSFKGIPIREKTLTLLADLYYSTQKYEKACGLYLQKLKEYPEGKDLAWCLYQVGNCYRRLGSFREAKKFYGILRERFPQSLWTKISQIML